MKERALGYTRVGTEYVPCRCSDNTPLEGHELRLYNEWEALHNKIHKLKEFIKDSPIFKQLDIEDAQLLEAQLAIMESYSSILKMRVYRL